MQQGSSVKPTPGCDGVPLPSQQCVVAVCFVPLTKAGHDSRALQHIPGRQTAGARAGMHSVHPTWVAASEAHVERLPSRFPYALLVAA